jgi:alkyl hydroperoxide reductase subunit AhpC
MADLAGRYEKRGIKVIGVNSNKTEATQKVADHADANNFGFVVMKDEGSVIADRFGASVTPEVFLIDGEMELRYHGALGNSRQPTRKAEEANSDDVVQALEALLSGAGVPVKTTKMFGCTIKR